jgi:hypothetical protein
MRLISAVFPGFVAIDKKLLFLRGSIVIIALSVKGKGATSIPLLILIFISKKLKKPG